MIFNFMNKFYFTCMDRFPELKYPSKLLAFLLPLFICSFIAVIGSLGYPLQILYINGSVRSDGDNSRGSIQKKDALIGVSHIGPGGGSGGTILLFLHTLFLGESAILSSAGGNGSVDGIGGGGGGRIHFHWSDIPTGDVYWPIALVNGSILAG